MPRNAADETNLHNPDLAGVDPWENFCPCDRCWATVLNWQRLDSLADTAKKLDSLGVDANQLIDLILFLLPSHQTRLGDVVFESIKPKLKDLLVKVLIEKD